nr:MAG TPA: hypothetical protein [Bacteriophage sp.]
MYSEKRYLGAHSSLFTNNFSLFTIRYSLNHDSPVRAYYRKSF